MDLITLDLGRLACEFQWMGPSGLPSTEIHRPCFAMPDVPSAGGLGASLREGRPPLSAHACGMHRGCAGARTDGSVCDCAVCAPESECSV